MTDASDDPAIDHEAVALRAALRASDQAMARLVDTLEPFDLSRWRAGQRDPFRALVRAIVGQQIAGRAAEAIYGRLEQLIGDRDPAAAVAGASDDSLRAVGLSANKMASLRDLAAHAQDGRLELNRLDELTDEEARSQLTAVRGIGAWTADVFLLAHLGRPDILPAGDLGVRQAVQRMYGLERLPTEKEVIGYGEAWRPNRSLATAYLYASLWSDRSTSERD